MVTGRRTTVKVPVDVPAASEGTTRRGEDPVFLTIKADHTLGRGEDDLEASGLGPAMERATKGDHDGRIFLRADKTVGDGTLMGVMNRLRSAGYLKVALVNLQGQEEGGETASNPAALPGGTP